MPVFPSLWCTSCHMCWTPVQEEPVLFCYLNILRWSSVLRISLLSMCVFTALCLACMHLKVCLVNQNYKNTDFCKWAVEIIKMNRIWAWLKIISIYESYRVRYISLCMTMTFMTLSHLIFIFVYGPTSLSLLVLFCVVSHVSIEFCPVYSLNSCTL